MHFENQPHENRPNHPFPAHSSGDLGEPSGKSVADPVVGSDAGLRARIAALEARNRFLEEEMETLHIYKDYAYTDTLTGIPNRRLHQERLLQEVSRAERGGQPLALALVDVDHLKAINDRVGHRGGDEVLAWFARVIRGGLRQPDTFCRIGGDEFSVILSDTSAENARVSLGRLRAKVAKDELRLDSGATARVTFSCGIASFAPGMNLETLIEQADSALYDAKARGRNRVSLAIGRTTMASPFVN